VAAVQPANATEIAFLKWVFTDGQQYLMTNGFSDLAVNERQSKLDQLSPGIPTVVHTNETTAASSPGLYIILGVMVLVIISGSLIRSSRHRKQRRASVNVTAPFNREAIDVPQGLYFDKSHTWAFMEKDGLVKVGIDDFLPHTTGLLTRLVLKQSGDQVKKGEPVITLVQHGKQLNINAPVSGTIRTTNSHLEKDPTLVNTSPYDKGWVYTIKPTNWRTETRFLKMAEAYKTWISSEYTRLKDFLATRYKGKPSGQLLLAFQDGGALKDNVLESFGPELWEDFQRDFIDTAALS
jgi:glycine cleavage system H lipoate-binding protein